MLQKRDAHNDSHTTNYSNCTYYSTDSTSKSLAHSSMSYSSTIDQFKQLSMRPRTLQTDSANTKKISFKYYNEQFQPVVHQTARTKYMTPNKFFSCMSAGKFLLMSNGERIRINENRLQDR